MIIVSYQIAYMNLKKKLPFSIQDVEKLSFMCSCKNVLSITMYGVAHLSHDHFLQNELIYVYEKKLQFSILHVYDKYFAIVLHVLLFDYSNVSVCPFNTYKMRIM